MSRHPSRLVTYRDIDQLDPEGMADEVIAEDRRALQTRVGPLVGVGVGDVKPRDGDGEDLVRGLGDGSLHGLLVGIAEDGRHGGGCRERCI